MRTSADARASIGSATRWRWMRSSGDALAHAAPLDVGQARRAEMGLVEMDVAVDERRQEEQPVEVDAFVGGRRGPRRVSRNDEAARDFHVGETPLGQARVGQDHQTRFSRFAAAYW